MVYQYRPLDVGKNEIRLLTVCHAKDIAGEESVLRVLCELTHHQLGPNTTHPIYSALSYVWGSLSDTVDIYLNSHITPVTRNLYEALQQLGGESCGFIWVDALCINQQDMTERTNQVLRMAEIYSGAKLVISWLGITQVDDGAVFGLIHRLWRETVDRWYPREELARQSIDNLEWVKACQAMGRFCQLPYWRRTWIIQEVALARNLEVRSGRFRCLGDWLFNAVDVSPFGTWGTQRTENWENVLTGDEYDAMQTVRGLRNVKESMKNNGQPLLHHLWMASLMRSEATDLRDRVYGMLGLANDAVTLVPKPNYGSSNPLRVMLTELAKGYVDRKGNFNVLLCQMTVLESLTYKVFMEVLITKVCYTS